MKWPPTESSNAAIIISGIEDDKIHQLSHLKGSPDSQIVVQVDLATVIVNNAVIATLRTALTGWASTQSMRGQRSPCGSQQLPEGHRSGRTPRYYSKH